MAMEPITEGVSKVRRPTDALLGVRLVGDVCDLLVDSGRRGSDSLTGRLTKSPKHKTKKTHDKNFKKNKIHTTRIKKACDS